jgi:hypothetical protein
MSSWCTPDWKTTAKSLCLVTIICAPSSGSRLGAAGTAVVVWAALDGAAIAAAICRRWHRCPLRPLKHPAIPCNLNTGAVSLGAGRLVTRHKHSSWVAPQDASMPGMRGGTHDLLLWACAQAPANLHGFRFALRKPPELARPRRHGRTHTAPAPFASISSLNEKTVTAISH